MLKTSGKFTLAFFALLSLAACKKEYTCSCSFSYLVNNQPVTETASFDIKYRSSAEATEACDDRRDDYLLNGANTVTCVSTVK